jgi:6-pyruvoyltetrahydropterin/6-carboxytetrahydropterin synthase
MLITKEFLFDAAHYLTNYKGKCEKLHGHTYKLHVTLKGSVQKSGMVIDFAEFKKIVEEHVLNKLDHTLLNDILKKPSAENLVIWIWDKLDTAFKSYPVKLYEIKLWETPTSFVTFSK